MSAVFCARGRLKMASVHGGRSEIAAICKGERTRGKEREVKPNQSNTCNCRILLRSVLSKHNNG